MIPIGNLTEINLAIEDTDEDDEEDLTDVIPAIEEAMKVIKWWKLSSDESYQVRKVIRWWKLSSDESYRVMKVI